MALSPRAVGLKYGFRSGLEEAVAEQLREAGVSFTYEETRLGFVWPARKATYTPDFLLPSGLFIETKGRFQTADRQKHLLVKAHHPEAEIRFVFSNPRQRISKTSSTSYADWCDKNGFEYAAKSVPKAWLK